MRLDETHIAYIRYFATGEGVRIFVVAGGSYAEAERLFKKYVPEYFHLGMTVQPLASPDEEMTQIIDLLPQAVLNLFAVNPPRSTEYFSTVHYNLS